MTSHILWDWNGTLLDDVALCVSTLNEICARRSIPPISVERYREVFTFPVIEYYKSVGFDFDKEPFSAPADEWVAIYCDRVWREATLHCGTLDVLRQLRAAGYTQSILSAHHRETLMGLVKHFGVGEFLNAVVGLDDFYAAGKLELGRAWLERSGLAPSSVVLIGDTLHDHEVAQALGVACVLIAGGHQSEARLRAAGTPLLDSVEGLPAWLLDGHAQPVTRR